MVINNPTNLNKNSAKIDSSAKKIEVKKISQNTPTAKPKKEETIQPTRRITSSKNIQYKYAGRETLGEILRKLIPPQFIPTKTMNTIFGIIFVLVLIISALQFPFGRLMSGDVDLTVNIGYPLHFLELEIQNAEKSPIKITNLIIDIIIYIILAYIINLIINLIMKTSIIQSEEEKKQYPKVFKNKEVSFAEKTTRGFLEKVGLNK